MPTTSRSPVLAAALEQVMRLARFVRHTPGVMVGAGRGRWQPVIPEPNGEQVITRHTASCSTSSTS